MNTTESSFSTRFKVGFFTIAGLLLFGLATLLVNNRPYWWRPCQLVHIRIEDATGLKTKSPIRSLGIEIGYLRSVGLSETHVTLGICVTAPVEILPTTRAYIRGEGFLGDKFVELKPVRYLGGDIEKDHATTIEKTSSSSPSKGKLKRVLQAGYELSFLWDWIVPSASAKNADIVPPKKPEPLGNSGTLSSKKQPLETEQPSSSLGPKEIPVAPTTRQAPGIPGTDTKSRPAREIPVGEEGQDLQHLMNQMNGVMENLKKAINPEDLRHTLKQLNIALENVSKTVSPEGGLNQTAQRTLAKLEDAIEQLRDMMTRINRGEGSIGKLVNDSSFADEIHDAIRKMNKMLDRFSHVRFVVDLGAANLPSFDGGRGWFQLGVWPSQSHYYLIGIAGDSRGRISNMVTTTTVNGISQTVHTQTFDQTSLLLTGMVGWVFFNRFDISVGALYNDGAASLNLLLGPTGHEDRISLRNDVYVRSSVGALDDRITLSVQPIKHIYVRAGIESFRSTFTGQNMNYLYGAGITFDDEDIKLLFAFK